MLVHKILQSKAEPGVVTVRPDATIADALKLLNEKRIGAVIVSGADERPLGILSERDIVRELARKGAGILNETVETTMTAEVVTCTRQDTADTVLQRMTDGRFRHIPVMDDQQMVGLISIGDVVKARLSELSMERDALQGMVMGH